jgi:hypothetical protein
MPLAVNVEHVNYYHHGIMMSLSLSANTTEFYLNLNSIATVTHMTSIRPMQLAYMIQKVRCHSLEAKRSRLSARFL